MIGRYGPDWVEGVLSEHEYKADKIIVGGSGNRYAFLDGAWYPVLCSEIIWIYTEDGRIDGRCGERVNLDDVACPSHQAQINQWRKERDDEASR